MRQVFVSVAISDAGGFLARNLVHERSGEAIELKVWLGYVGFSLQACDDLEIAVETAIGVALELVLEMFSDDPRVGYAGQLEYDGDDARRDIPRICALSAKKCPPLKLLKPCANDIVMRSKDIDCFWLIRLFRCSVPCEAQSTSFYRKRRG